MSRKKIFALWLMTLAVMGGVGFELWLNYAELDARHKRAMMPPPAPKPVEAPVAAPEASTTTVSDVAPAAVAASTATAVKTAPAVAPPAAKTASAPTAVAAATSPVKTPEAAKPAPDAGKMKKTRVSFSLTDADARMVSVAGTFNRWQAKMMTPAAGGKWSIALDLAPGEYAYNFYVDGKPIRDPNQPRSDEKGHSLLSVPAAKP